MFSWVQNIYVIVLVCTLWLSCMHALGKDITCLHHAYDLRR